MKHIYIIYNPGYAGNFLQKLFSLSTETVPSLYQTDLNTPIVNLSTEERIEKYKFSNVLTNVNSWQAYHRKWADMYQYLDIMKAILPQQFKYIIFSMHEVEYQLFNSMRVRNHEYAPIMLPINSIVLGVSLDLTKYGTWIKNTQQALKFIYRLEEKQFYNKFINSLQKDKIINLTKMLDSYTGFCDEYVRVCKVIGLEPDIESATLLWDDWYETRFECFQ